MIQLLVGNLNTSFICLGPSSESVVGFDSPLKNSLQSSNMMLLSKEINEKDRQLKFQLLVASTSDEEKNSSERIWMENGFFGNIRSDFNIHKKDFPENALCYVNQAYLSTKDGEIIICCQYVILGQVVPLRNAPEALDEYISTGDHLVKMYVPMYENKNGKFLGVKETAGYVMLRGDWDETFWTYGFDEEKSSVLYCYSKQPMPNVFKGTVFNAYSNEILNERDRNKFSKIFFYLPSITDRKEKIYQYRDQVSLTPVDCKLEKFADFSPEGYNFNPSHLQSSHPEYENAKATLYKFFENSIAVSNTNLIQNVYSLMKKKNIKYSDLKWGVSMPQSRIDNDKFSLGY